MRCWLAALFALLVASGAASGQDGKAEDPRWTKLKSLVGDWTGPDGKAVMSSFRLTAAGSALVETHFPGSPHEMLTVYTMDGKDLVLTHYCMLANQPKLKADAAFDGKSLKFERVALGNAPDVNVVHMHRLELAFTDADHVTARWGKSEGGKDGQPHVLELSRKK